jgi:hypothetical protein
VRIKPGELQKACLIDSGPRTPFPCGGYGGGSAIDIWFLHAPGYAGAEVNRTKSGSARKKLDPVGRPWN